MLSAIRPTRTGGSNGLYQYRVNMRSRDVAYGNTTKAMA